MYKEHGFSARPGPDPAVHERTIVVEGLEARVRMHESRTSAVAWFVDGRARELRVSLIARAGGGALTTVVPEVHAPAIRALGYLLWPKVEPEESPSGVYRAAPDRRVGGAASAPDSE